MSEDLINYGDDEMLMFEFRNGSRPAFIFIWDKLAGQLIFFVENVIKSPKGAEDIIVEVFYELFHVRKEMKSIPEITKFLYLTARIKCIKYLQCQNNLNGQNSDELQFYADLSGRIETERVKAVLLQAIVRG